MLFSFRWSSSLFHPPTRIVHLSGDHVELNCDNGWWQALVRQSGPEQLLLQDPSDLSEHSFHFLSSERVVDKAGDEHFIRKGTSVVLFLGDVVLRVGHSSVVMLCVRAVGIMKKRRSSSQLPGPFL